MRKGEQSIDAATNSPACLDYGDATPNPKRLRGNRSRKRPWPQALNGSESHDVHRSPTPTLPLLYFYSTLPYPYPYPYPFRVSGPEQEQGQGQSGGCDAGLSSGPATDGNGSGSCTQSPLPPPLAPRGGGAWARIRQGLAIRRLDSQVQPPPQPGSVAAMLVTPSDLAPRPRLRDVTRCAGCSAGLSRGLLGSGAARLCHCRRLFYCTACQVNEPHVIPARLLLAWDQRPRSVCREALADLFHAHIIAVPRDLVPKALAAVPPHSALVLCAVFPARSLCGLPPHSALVSPCTCTARTMVPWAMRRDPTVRM